MAIQVKLPDRLKADVEKQMAARGFKTASDYVVALVREDQRRLDQGDLEEQLVSGIESAPKIEATKHYWSRKRESLARRLTRSRKTR